VDNIKLADLTLGNRRVKGEVVSSEKGAAPREERKKKGADVKKGKNRPRIVPKRSA